jgi:16S rRNA processing protein RimM
MTNWDDMAVVGRVARPHGLRGDVVVNPETDFVAERFRPGATVWMRSAGREEQLTIGSARVQNGRPVVGFVGLSSIEAAERLAGLELRVPEEALQPLEPGQYYEHQLVGCSVSTADGPVGTVVRVDRAGGGSRLVVEGARGEILVPLAVDICVEIDVAGRRIRIEPPQGLLELNEVRHRHDLSPDGGGRPRRRGDQPRR